MSIYAFGDSHVQYFFQLCPDIKTFWLGPRTMHRVGREGAGFIPHLASPGPDDTIVLVFGEIDVRCHVPRIAETRKQILDWTIGDLVSRYVSQVRLTLDHFGIRSRVVMMGITPPMDPVARSPELPTYGPLDQRVLVCRYLNSVLAEHTKSFRISFVPIPSVYENPDGSLKMNMSDGHAHISMDHATHICDALGDHLGVALRFNGLSDDEQVRLDAMRERAFGRNDFETLWNLGRFALTSAMAREAAVW